VSHTKEEHRLKVFENRVMRRVFGPKREEVAGDWRRLQNEELHKLYYSLNIIGVVKSRRVRWAESLARMGDMRNACQILVEKPEWKRALGRHTGRCY
jgi:hypothetical protein